MGEMPLSLNVDAEIKHCLEREAALLNVSESEIAEQAIAAYLDFQAQKREMIAHAAAQADKGAFISSEAMLAWMERLEVDIEAPAPEPDVILPPQR